MIPVNTPLLDGNEKKYLIECIDSGWISSEGPFVGRLEEGMCRLTGRQHGIAVCNGSVALDIAVQALRLGSGDEVIMPTFTIISCAAAVVRAGATPVFVDVDPLTWNMGIELVERAVTDKTRAIMVVHIYGLPVDMDPILELARSHKLFIIEDAAEVHGQTYRGRPCGSFGDISTFSFYPNKHITTGEGGMVLADDPDLAERCRSLRNLCFQKRRFVHEELGWNARMSNLQAAVGVAQLERLPEFILRKREIGKRYQELLSDVPFVQLPVIRTDYAENIYWVFGLVLDESVPFSAAEFSTRLAVCGIGTRPFFYPMHQQPVFAGLNFKGSACPVAERIAESGLYVPSGLGLSDADIVRVAAAVRECLQELG
jgi:perosamine synthetase